MAGRILLAEPIHSAAEDWLEARCEVVRPRGPERAVLQAAIADCEAMIVRTTVVDAALIAAAGRLRIIAKHGTGTETIDVCKATEHGVLVTNCPGENGPAVAEFALACILLVLRPVIAGQTWLRSANPTGSLVVASEKAGLAGAELSSQTVGVVGWGDIGRRVGLAVRALGADVIAHDPARAEQIRDDHVALAGRLDDLLTAASIVTLHVPLTPATRGLLGREELRLMRPGAALINTSRGGVVDEAALGAALDSGHLKAAAIDVFAREPPARGDQLLQTANALCTPHMAGLTTESLLRMGMCAAQAVVDALDGRRPRHVVNAGAIARNGAKR